MNSYKVEEYDGEDVKRPIDLILRDPLDDTIMAFFWGDTLANLELECNHLHPECDDPHEQGICPLCGATCDWDLSEDEYGHTYPEPTQWHEEDVNPAKIYHKLFDNTQYEVAV